MESFHANNLLKHNFRPTIKEKRGTKERIVTSSNKKYRKTILQKYIDIYSKKMSSTNNLLQRLN
jgi:hypothetical protein